MAQLIVGGGACYNIMRVVLVVLALASSGEAKGLRNAVRPARVVNKVKDLLAARASEVIRGVDPTEKVFNVLNYEGVDPSGMGDSTMGFIKAWVDTCQWNGRSRLVIPSGTFSLGEVVFQGKCMGAEPKVVEIKGTLKGVPDPSAFTSDCWILFQEIDGVIIFGGGILDGQGPSVWQYSDCKTNPDCQRMPVSLKFDKVHNAIVSKLRSVDAKGFHVGVTNSKNLRLYNLHITAPDDSPNTDGIHISRSDNVKIARCVIGTGDDCISMIQGCTNIKIKKVTCGPGHGISIGSLGKYKNEANVDGISATNCTLTGTDNGVRIKTWPNSPPSEASRITFKDIIMNGVKNPIIIDQEYNSKEGQKVIPSRVRISNVRFINIKGTSASPEAVSLVCSQQFPCEKVQLQDVNLGYVGPAAKGPMISTCRNTKGLLYRGIQNPPACK